MSPCGWYLPRTSPTTRADLTCRVGRVEPELVHRVEDAPLHRLLAVGDVGQRASHDHAHRIFEIAALGEGRERQRLVVVRGVLRVVTGGWTRAAGRIGFAGRAGRRARRSACRPQPAARLRVRAGFGLVVRVDPGMT